MRGLSIIIATVVVIIAIEAGVGLGLIFSGWTDVGADTPDATAVAWVVKNTRKHSIQARLAHVPIAQLNRPNIVAHGAKLYAKHCAGCHLAPGMQPTSVHRGESPQPPAFAEFESAPAPKKSYWIIKHGIKMTGMPSWQQTLSNQQIWAIAAFLQKLPRLSADRYQQMAQRDSGH
jgi:mono/diheme cytochrome c family protein